VAEPFTREFHVRWGDLDFNGHMKNTAYLDTSADVRLMYFDSRGFSLREFERLRIGPVIQQEELQYFRELRMLQAVKVTLVAAGLSEDGSRFRLRNEFFAESGKLAARVYSTGGWLDQAARKLTKPPEDVAKALLELVRSDDFVTMPPVG
jgi:acyl-CoA thioester hydrolase